MPCKLGLSYVATMIAACRVTMSAFGIKRTSRECGPMPPTGLKQTFLSHIRLSHSDPMRTCEARQCRPRARALSSAFESVVMVLTILLRVRAVSSYQEERGFCRALSKRSLLRSGLSKVGGCQTAGHGISYLTRRANCCANSLFAVEFPGRLSVKGRRSRGVAQATVK